LGSRTSGCAQIFDKEALAYDIPNPTPRKRRYLARLGSSVDSPYPWTSRRRSSDSRKVRPPGWTKTVEPCPSALPATVLAGGSCSPTVMLNFGDASFKRRGEVRTVPRVPRGTRASCVLPRTSCTESARAAEPAGRAARRRSSTCAHHAPHAPLNPLADFRLLRRPTLLLLEEVIAAQCFRPPRCSARRPRRHARLRL